MDFFSALTTRHSCRSFLPDPVSDAIIEKVIDAAVQAPSPLNGQPWSFVVITNPDAKERIMNEAVRYKQTLLEKSGWKWLDKYATDFIKTVPVMIAVMGDPKRTGADAIMEGAGNAWREACGAATQNLMLAAQSLGLSTLWFTMFDKAALKEIIGVDDGRVPLSLVFLGKASSEIAATPRKTAKELTRFLR
jgi:nitroreductase